MNTFGNTSPRLFGEYGLANKKIQKTRSNTDGLNQTPLKNNLVRGGESRSTNYSGSQNKRQSTSAMRKKINQSSASPHRGEKSEKVLRNIDGIARVQKSNYQSYQQSLPATTKVAIQNYNSEEVLPGCGGGKMATSGMPSSSN